MHNEPNQTQWNAQSGQPQWGPQQYNQGQYGQQPPQQWGSPPTSYAPPQYGQGQYNVPQYGQGQYNVPPYAQAQPQAQQANSFLMRWLMMGLAIRIVLLIVVPLLLCGGCAFIGLLSTLGH